MTDKTQLWNAISAHSPSTLVSLLADGQWDERAALLIRTLDGLRFDWTKTHLDAGLLDQFFALADASGLAAARSALFDGEAINNTEGRAAEHTAQRGEGSAEAVAVARAFHQRMRGLVEAVDAGALGEIRHVVHIGIGGSALGPDLLIDALARDAGRYDVAVVSNVDGAALEHAVRHFDPAHTLVVLASKTFTTTETLMNGETALGWLRAGGVQDPYGHVIALTAAPDKAVEWGVDETRVLPFSETVGGRYSLWSSIGFPAALAIGWDGFAELLDGAAAMDRHFRNTDWRGNIPVIAAFADLYYTQVAGAATRAVFAYDERLRLLPSYLQQLEMESNGKSVLRDGSALGRPSAPITWGGVGTDAQHAVFQLLHQGTHVMPTEFIASIEAGHDFDRGHHDALLANCFAQGAALAAGRTHADGARAYAGDRPSSTILLDDVTPATVGALIAFYEHRVFVSAVLLGINPFDQFGVELGKEMARSVGEGGGALDPSTRALMAASGIARG